MTRALALICGLVLSFSALACRYASEEDARRADLEDRGEQRALVRGLAREADAIFLGRVVELSKANEEAKFEVIEVLKGTFKPHTFLNYLSATEFVISSCGHAAPGFRNAVVNLGDTYFVYVLNGALARASDIEREWPEISVREERRLVRRAIKL